MENRTTLLHRRNFVIGATATVAALAAHTSLAQENAPTWEDAIKKILGDAKPVDGKMLLDMPEIAENGNTVPFTVSVESPMSDADYVKAVHIVSTGNPQPAVVTFHFTPQSGKAAAASRMRLARTQDVIALAELSDGKVLQAKRSVKVTIGGCGG
jgi:sulfur-oxidizing protein SoxY